MLWLLDNSGSMKTLPCLEPGRVLFGGAVHMDCEIFAPRLWEARVVDDAGDGDTQWLDGDGVNDFEWPLTGDPEPTIEYKAYSVFFDSLDPKYDKDATYALVDSDFPELFEKDKVYRHGTLV